MGSRLNGFDGELTLIVGEGKIEQRLAPACREPGEGVITKRRDCRYECRSSHWLKMKYEASQEFVVRGFTDPRGVRKGRGALLVRYFEDDDLVYAGKLGTGLDTKVLLELRAQLDALEIPQPPSLRRWDYRACARTGCVPPSWYRPTSSSGRNSVSRCILDFSASEPTRRLAKKCGRRVDQATRQGSVPSPRFLVPNPAAFA
jgi:hypothetical protein